MDRNSVLGLVLIAVILFVFSWLNAPDEEALKKQQELIAEQDSLNRVKSDSSNTTKTVSSLDNSDTSLTATSSQATDTNEIQIVKTGDTLVLTDSLKEVFREQEKLEKLKGEHGPWVGGLIGDEKTIELENEKIKVVFSNKGGQVKRVYIKGHKTYNDYINEVDSSLYFFEQNSTHGISLATGKNTQSYFFKVTSQSENDITFRLHTDNENQYIEYRYFLPKDAYHLQYDISFNGLSGSNAISPDNMTFDWTQIGRSVEKLASDERMNSAVIYKAQDDIRRWVEGISSETNLETETTSRTTWVAFKHKFFSSILINESGFDKENSKVGLAQLESDDLTDSLGASLNLGINDLNNGSVSMKWYFGPNDYNILKSYGHDMEEIVYLGRWIIEVINIYLIRPIFVFLTNSGMNIGIVIMILTVFIRLMIFPLMMKNYMSSARMRVLKPEVDEINKKYSDKKDAMKKQQEQMALYRKTGVNPMAGCIPMLIQMPILISMFRLFPSAIELRQQSFLWADDLSSFDAIVSWSNDIPVLSSIYGNHISLFTLLMAASTLLYTRMNSSQMATPQQPGMPNMKVMMNIFPVMMIFFFNKFAAGLSYYYLLGNLTSMGIMYVIKTRFIDEDKIRAKIEENKKKPKGKSKFQQRMEEMQKSQNRKTRRN